MADGSLAIDAPAGPANETMCADLGCPQCAAGHQVLWAGGIENIWMTALLFGVVVLFTLIWECATERLEHAVSDHNAYKDLLEKVFKELTLLGLLSFILFIVQDTQLGVNYDLIVAFEFAHYLIFFMAMIFILLSLISMRGCLATKRVWDSTALTSVSEVCDAFDQKFQRASASVWGRCLRRCGCGLWQVHLDLSNEQQAVEWCLLRVLFLREYGVQTYFDFAKYTRKSLTLAIVAGIEITPGTWAFMLCFVLVIAAQDLVQNVRIVDNSTRRLLASAGGAHHEVLNSTESVNHVLLIAVFSWSSLIAQASLVLFLRGRQRMLLQRKLHMHGGSEELTKQLKDGVRSLQKKVINAEIHGHDHLRATAELSMDDDYHAVGLREAYEGSAYSESVGRRVRQVSHCVQMWSCFSLSYYCLDLAVIVNQTQSSTVVKILWHTVLLSPHVILAMVVSPLAMKLETLLSCVVWPVDELVATVTEHMESTDRLCEVLRRKLVDAHRQENEEADVNENQPSHISDIRSGGIAGARAPGLRLTFTENEVDAAARCFFTRLADGDGEVSLPQLRIGLHKINAYFKEGDWTMIKRLIDQNHNGYALLVDVLRMLQPAENRNCVMHWGHRDVSDTGSLTGANASQANPTPRHGLGALEDSNSRARRWVYESVDAPTDTLTSEMDREPGLPYRSQSDPSAFESQADHPAATADLESVAPVVLPQP